MASSLLPLIGINMPHFRQDLLISDGLVRWLPSIGDCVTVEVIAFTAVELSFGSLPLISLGHSEVQDMGVTRLEMEVAKVFVCPAAGACWSFHDLVLLEVPDMHEFLSVCTWSFRLILYLGRRLVGASD